jgi:hypothetical protein
MKKKIKAKGKSGRWLPDELAWRSHHGESFDVTDSLEEIILKSMDYPGASLLDAKGFSMLIARHVREFIKLGGDIKPGGRKEERKESLSNAHAGMFLHEAARSIDTGYRVNNSGGRNLPKLHS